MSRTNYVTQITGIGKILPRTGSCMNNEWIGCSMLAGLPEKYFLMIVRIENSGIAIRVDEVKSWQEMTIW